MTLTFQISIAELIWFVTGKLSLIWWRRNKVAITDPNWVLDSGAKNRRGTVMEQVIKKNDQGVVYWEEFKQYVQ